MQRFVFNKELIHYYQKACMQSKVLYIFYFEKNVAGIYINSIRYMINLNWLIFTVLAKTFIFKVSFLTVNHLKSDWILKKPQNWFSIKAFMSNCQNLISQKSLNFRNLCLLGFCFLFWHFLSSLKIPTHFYTVHTFHYNLIRHFHKNIT